ncbi:MAG: hypothetical protein A2Z99_07160 [Treponema sp. GWB1_62_6]|nr:MAG: hypothetical protein A2Y36_11585 [Treponema sp. GWA1_62_8]OHE62052.1 MAG: hypothetical protein A2Z99_07160 [Treponema sp. GWB1_62_6]OHE65496.1 MAG: hypothetical protein A2001_10215 [Treponema sp. GWC1_61_84]HCM27697.1 DUF554 domain-containing protein [Treponema sp.]
MFATIINCLAVIFGSLIGLLVSGRVKENYRSVVFDGAGVTTLIIGVSMALQSGRIIALAVSLILGGLAGTLMNIDGAILGFGVFLERLTMGRHRAAKAVPAAAAAAASAAAASAAASGDDRGWNFGHGFLNASVLFCVGAMALVGSFRAGTEGDSTLILTKSVLDGFMAILMTAAMGPGVAFSALPILVYQGALTLAAGFLKPFVSALMLSELTGIGGALVIMISLNLLGLKKIKTADFLPSLVSMIVFVLFDPAIARLAAVVGL